MAIYLLRHGQSEGNANNIFQGRIDTALTATGVEQAQTAGRWLKARGVRPAAACSSPLQRARDTARIISGILDGPVPEENGEIAEFNAGSLEGLAVSALEDQYPEYYTRELGVRGDFSDYGGESYAEIQSRLKAFTSRFSTGQHGSIDTLVVSHGGAIYQLLKLWCGWPAPRHFFTRIGNCTCFKLELREFTGHLGAEMLWMVPLELMQQDLGSAA